MLVNIRGTVSDIQPSVIRSMTRPSLLSMETKATTVVRLLKKDLIHVRISSPMKEKQQGENNQEGSVKNKTSSSHWFNTPSSARQV